jgi:hypothetical protein
MKRRAASSRSADDADWKTRSIGIRRCADERSAGAKMVSHYSITPHDEFISRLKPSMLFTQLSSPKPRERHCQCSPPKLGHNHSSAEWQRNISTEHTATLTGRNWSQKRQGGYAVTGGTRSAKLFGKSEAIVVRCAVCRNSQKTSALSCPAWNDNVGSYTCTM